MLLQEYYAIKGQPWMLLVSCMLLNLTTRKQVDSVREQLFGRYHAADMMAAADRLELHEMISSLGFANRRTDALIRMSTEYVRNGIHSCSSAEEVGMLYGIGKYATDSWAIFISLRPDVKPSDKELMRYMQRAVKCRDCGNLLIFGFEQALGRHSITKWVCSG